MPSLFITLEGIEGAGKSTQARLLVNALERTGIPVTLTREPGGGSDTLSTTIRTLLKDPGVWRGLGLAEIYFYAAARAHHIETVILPALERGEVVVCDRYLDSTRAYQGYGRGRPLDLIDAVHRHPPLTLEPARTVLYDLDPASGLDRARERSHTDAPGYDDESLAFFERVRGGFLAIATQDVHRVRIVDAVGSVSEVHDATVAALADLLPGLRPEDLR